MAAPTPTYTATEEDSLDSPSLGLFVGALVVASVAGAVVVAGDGVGVELEHIVSSPPL